MNRSGIKGQGLMLDIVIKPCNTIQTEPFQLGPSNLVNRLVMTRGRHVLFSRSGVKGQGHILNIVVKPCKHDTD